MTEIIGKVIENYKIVSFLGKGGMGIVYKAYDTKLDRYVAIKMLTPRILDDQRFIERFKREAKNQAKMTHPNIVTVYGFIEHKELLGIAMEYVEGEGLDKIIYRQGRLHLYDVVYVTKQVLAGIGYAHSKGFVHRDIKPSNIIIGKDGMVKIMDFGISKSMLDIGMTKTGAKIGTPYYMSPEQFRGGDVTQHSDIYSIGCTIFEMITGKPPFYSENEYDVMEGHMKQTAPEFSKIIPGTPEVVDKVFLKSLLKDPNARYNSCEEFQEAVKELDKIAMTTSDLFRPKKMSPTRARIYSVIGLSVFITIILALSWFVYVQVDELLKSNELDKLEKYNLNSFFSSGDEFNFSKIEKQKTNLNFTINSIKFITDRFGFAMGDSGTVITTQDSGANWTNVIFDSTLGINNVNIYDAYFFQNGKSFFVGTNGSLFRSDDFLKTVRRTNFSGDYTLYKVHFQDSQTGFILGSRGLIMKTNDGGNNWIRINSNTQSTLYDIDFANEKSAIISGWDGVALRSSDKGDTWSVIPSFTTKYLRSVDFFDEDLGLVVGGGGTVFRTKDGGDSWFEAETGTTSGLQHVQFLSKEYAIAVGGRGTFIISTNGGASWKNFDTGNFLSYTNVELSASGHIYISGVNGTIFKLF
ncbi:MAG: protein kinase [Melioribacteraceae bacterium]|nr:protein kinase [Melioribacteraceae bacterium]MCF8355492.1 protein kinase [Melioribacteraceae bacterium]MCF8394917.1 protein kinase [Melioribacteraceae bacterium]MCF8420441.1 protein kinase [Melioribacteraceae bacterium]